MLFLCFYIDLLPLIPRPLLALLKQSNDLKLHPRLSQILSPAFQKFLKENQDADIAKFLLSKKQDVDLKEAADQIISHKKAKGKLPTWYVNDQIVFPPPLSVEQSSSGEAADYKRNLISGDQLVDLTGGMGVDCLALSQNFKTTTYVERDEWLSAVFDHNQKILSEKEITVENTPAEKYLEGFSGKASFFIDPARRDQEKKKVFRFADCSPNVVELLPLFQKKAHNVLIKAAPLIDLTQGINELQFVSEVHVLSIKNEVKEVLFLLDFHHQSRPKITCVNLESGQEVFEFTFEEERATEVAYGEVKKYIYDPNSSILKAGAFKTIASRFHLEKVAPNTHLYTSDQLINNFPGRCFEVLHNNVSKKDIKKLLPEGKANVITKNHPLSAEELKRQLKLKDGGDSFVIGFRDKKNQPIMSNCERVS